MVTVIEKYKDDISGKIFDNMNEAIQSEIKSADIRKSFEFYIDIKDPTLSFKNGEYSIPRTKDFYERILTTIIKLINKYEPSIVASYNKANTPFTIENIAGLSNIRKIFR